MTTFDLLRNEPEHASYALSSVSFGKGDPSVGMLVVLEGEVEIIVDGHVVETVPSGGVFSELARIETAPRSATARAKTDTRVALIDARRCNFLVQWTPNFALQMWKPQAERLRRRPTPSSACGSEA